MPDYNKETTKGSKNLSKKSKNYCLTDSYQYEKPVLNKEEAKGLKSLFNKS
jgi:hypothetical protein